MLVSHAKRFIFLKTIKTAGTSLEMALQRYCLPEGETAGEATGALVSAAGIVGARGAGVRDETWYNHMPARKIRDRLPEGVWDSYVKICPVRNPWDKTVSWFHFAFRKERLGTPAETVAAFRAWLAGTEAFGQDRPIHFFDGRPVADRYLRYETLQGDFDALCADLGLGRVELPRFKTELREPRIPWQDYYDRELRRKVAQAYRKEIRHFGWTFGGAARDERGRA